MEKKDRRTTGSTDGMPLTVNQRREVSAQGHDGKTQTTGSMSNSAKELDDIPGLSPDSLHKSIAHVGQLTGQKPSLEIVAVEVQNSDHRECMVVRACDIQSSGDVSLDDQDQRKEIRKTPTVNTVWNKFLRGLKINSVHTRPTESLGPTPDVPGKSRGKSIAWVRNLRNFFVPRNKQHNHNSISEMSETKHNYLLLQDGNLPAPATVPSLAQHSSEDLRSKNAITSVLWRMSDSDPQHLHENAMKVGSRQESEDSTPLLEYPGFPKADAVVGCDSGSGSSGQLVYDPLTSHSLPPPWILRQWKKRDSQKYLRIHPAKELLFHLTDEAEKKYTCSIELENKTKRYVAFKFKSTCPQGYSMGPRHGVLAPHTRIQVKGLKMGDPLRSFTSKKDLFVIITLPVPTDLINKNSVSSSIFGRFQDQCCCEGVLQAIFCLGDIKSNDSSNDKQAKMEDVRGGLNLRLSSIEEEQDFEYL